MHLLALTGAALAFIAPATAPPGLPPAGPIPAGTYTLELLDVPFTVTVPDGWESDPPNYLSFTSSDGFVALFPIELESTNLIPIDNCSWRDSEAIEVETADELGAAMQQQGGSLVSPAQPLEIGPYSGVVFTTAPIPMTDCDDGHQMVFMDRTRDGGWWYPGDGIHDVKIILALDLPTGLGLIHVRVDQPLLPADQRMLLDVIDSIHFGDPA